MARWLRWGTCLVFVIATSAANAAPVKGDGLPVGDVNSGPAGVTNPGDSARYVTVPASGGTVVAGVARNGGQIRSSRFLRGNFTVPAVALDGSASGLSRDGSTLALIRPRARFPQRRTSLVILDVRSLRPQSRPTLPGDFSFDAISPDGRLLYFVQYLSRRDPTRYAVRAYDVRAGHLVRAPIVDPRQPEERMGGFPITRTYSADGRWAYTLYDGAGKHPFVHALDTVGRTAACIDLDSLTGRRDLFDLRFNMSGAQTLDVVDTGGAPVVSVDRKTFRVIEASSGDAQGSSSVAFPLALAAGAALLAAGGLTFVVRRRRRLAPG